MPGLLASLFLFLAQAAPAAGKGAGPAAAAEPNFLYQFLPLMAVPFIFYFMMLRPQQVQEKKRRELINNLKKNDKVLTSAGIYGTVISVDEKGNRVQLRLDDDGKVKVTFTKISILAVITDPAE
jgi:preprotein translocase subunit YajC